MRIRLAKGKQREFIYYNKGKKTWRELAEAIGVTEVMLKEWRLEHSLISGEAFKKLKKPVGFQKHIKERLVENWGQIKGGNKSKGTTKQILIPKRCEELAELIGIILGDGNIHKIRKGKKVGVYAIRIAGDSRYERPYFDNVVSKLFQQLFDVKTVISKSKVGNSLYLTAYSKKLVQYFEKNGFPAGNKIVNQLRIPGWIMKNRGFLKACLRGLIDTDGCIHRMSKKDPQLLRISFKNHNKPLLKQVRAGFIELGFHPSKIITGNYFVLSRKTEVSGYIQTIGFNNKKHQKRLQEFSPVV